MTSKAHPLAATLKDPPYYWQVYQAKLNRIFKDQGEQIVQDAKALKAASENGKMSPAMIGVLCVDYGLPFKAVTEYLEEQRVIATGAYQRMIDSGITATRVLEAGKELIATRDREVQP